MRYRYLVDLRRGISVFAIFRKVLRYWVPPNVPLTQVWLCGRSCFSCTNPSHFWRPLQSLLLRYLAEIHRLRNFNMVFQVLLTKRAIFVFTESWSCDILLQKAYSHQKPTKLVYEICLIPIVLWGKLRNKFMIFALHRGGHWGVPNTAIPYEKMANTEIPRRKSTKYRYRIF